MHDPFILNLVQRTLQATVDVMPSKFYLDPDYDLIQFEEGYEKPPRDVFYAKYNELLNIDRYNDLRRQRNKLLQDTDWTQTNEVVMQNQEEWVAYRQALRDLPANTEDPTHPEWPEPPQVKIVPGKTQLDDTRADLETTRADLTETKSELATNRADLTKTKSELETTRADLTTTKTQLDEERTQLRDTQTELEVTKLKLANVEARLKILEVTISS